MNMMLLLSMLLVDAQAQAVLDLQTQPPGARVVIDGKPMGTTPFEWSSLSTGSSHTFQFFLDGHDPGQLELSLPVEGKQTVVVHLNPEGMAAPMSSGGGGPKPPELPGRDEPRVDRSQLDKPEVEDGRLDINCVAGSAEIHVNGKLVARSTPVQLDIDAGVHEIQTAALGGRVFDSRVVKVEPDKAVRVSLRCN